MVGTQQVLATGAAVVAGPRRPPTRRRRLRSPEHIWAIGFAVPYVAVLLAFAVYPIGYGFWMASKPSLYAELVSDPIYLAAVINTALFVGLGVNLKMFLALMLSGFFMRRRAWIKALLIIFILPWALPAIPAFISFHWILINDGFLHNVLWELFGIESPIWFNDRWLALGADTVCYIWKWLPFWTVIFVAGRMAIPQELYEAAAIDGATAPRCFLHVVLPLLANLYLVCTLLSALWAIGDFTTVAFVSGGAPLNTTEVLATLGIQYAFDGAQPSLGMAAVMSALPALIRSLSCC